MQNCCYIKNTEIKKNKEIFIKKKIINNFFKKKPHLHGASLKEKIICVNLNYKSVKKLLNLNNIYKRQIVCQLKRKKIKLNNE